MLIKSLGYVGFCGQDTQLWSEFARKFLGMQVVDATAEKLYLRMDQHKQRLVIDQNQTHGQQFFGWDVGDASSLQALIARFEAHQVNYVQESQSLAQERCVQELVSIRDPLGNRLEFFYGAEVDLVHPFNPSRSISGFRTGHQGVGHAVLTVEKIEEVMPFYQDVLGFQLSDYALRPFRAFFFHVNTRHHSFALVETGKNGVHHLMVELCSLDDVGQGYDLALTEPDRVGVTLGRHSNDFMTSFYMKTPAGIMIEYGWGGREIDPASWQSFECTLGPSLWGHERTWLPPEKRAEALALRLQAAAEGNREPVYVMEGNYQVMQDQCPWTQKSLQHAS